MVEPLWSTEYRPGEAAYRAFRIFMFISFWVFFSGGEVPCIADAGQPPEHRGLEPPSSRQHIPDHMCSAESSCFSRVFPRAAPHPRLGAGPRRRAEGKFLTDAPPSHASRFCVTSTSIAHPTAAADPSRTHFSVASLQAIHSSGPLTYQAPRRLGFPRVFF